MRPGETAAQHQRMATIQREPAVGPGAEFGAHRARVDRAIVQRELGRARCRLAEAAVAEALRLHRRVRRDAGRAHGEAVAGFETGAEARGVEIAAQPVGACDRDRAVGAALVPSRGQRAGDVQHRSC